MTKKIKARYKGGVLEPLEPIKLRDGEEVEVAVPKESSTATSKKPFGAAAGSWADYDNLNEILAEIEKEDRVAAEREVQL